LFLIYFSVYTKVRIEPVIDPLRGSNLLISISIHYSSVNTTLFSSQWICAH